MENGGRTFELCLRFSAHIHLLLCAHVYDLKPGRVALENPNDDAVGAISKNLIPRLSGGDQRKLELVPAGIKRCSSGTRRVLSAFNKEGGI